MPSAKRRAGRRWATFVRQLGVAEATFYAWKKKYAHLGVSELRRLRQLEEENARLKRLIATLSLDKHMRSVHTTAGIFHRLPSCFFPFLSPERGHM